MDDFRTHTRIIDPVGPHEREWLAGFVAPMGLGVEDDILLTVIVEDAGQPIATASLAGDVIKCVAVVPEYDGEGAAARATSAVIAEAEDRGIRRQFIYTKPSNRAIFEGIGFRPLAMVDTADTAEGVLLLERGHPDFSAWIHATASVLPDGQADGAVIVNCNPFTLGHRWLVEQAAAACDRLLVLVLAGDRSSFPGAVRLHLVREGTADLSNVTVASGDAYCVSGATFPSYYLKEKSRAAELQAALDATLFASAIAPALGIRKRFVGSEPYCPVTGAYNQALAAVLPRHGVELVQFERMERDGRAVSASAVRACLRNGDLDGACSLVPPTTAAWLRSDEASVVIKRIQAGDGRH